MQAAPVQVLVVDDDPLACQALRLQLEVNGFDVVGVGTTGSDALEQTKALEPDILLLDIVMPDMDGLEALAAIKLVRPRTCVVILTAHRVPAFATKALVAGAGAFLTKRETDLKQLPDMLRLVLEGEEAVVEADLLRKAIKEARTDRNLMTASEESLLSELTPQERRILRLIAEGFSNREIGNILDVTQNTVKSHVSSIYKKLDISDRTQAALFSARHAPNGGDEQSSTSSS